MPAGETRTWTARGEDDEARMWTDFLDWLGDPCDVALYCWARYEFGKFDQAARDQQQMPGPICPDCCKKHLRIGKDGEWETVAAPADAHCWN